MFRVPLAFDLIAALLQNVLRQHAQMAAKRDSRREDGFHLRQNFPASLRLDKFRADGHQSFCVGNRIRSSRNF